VNDPKRLLEEAPSELERSLLKAVAAEQPSQDHRLRVREAMVLGSSVAPASAATGASTGMGKMAILGIVAAGGVALLLFLGRTRQPPSSPSSLQDVPVAPVAPESPVAAVAAPEPPAVESPDPATPRAAHRSLTASPAPSANSDIREQIRLIDEARAAVGAHDVASALRALDQYRSKFPG